VRGSIGGEKGCREKKTGDGGARCFLKRYSGMEQWGGGSGTSGTGARWRGRRRGPCSQQRPSTSKAGVGRVAREQGRRGGVREGGGGAWALVALGCWVVCYGPGPVNSAVFALLKFFQTNLNLIQSKGGFPKLKSFKIKYGIERN
jgi:hypothetical protein